jgi:hypothetical protein
MSYILRGAMNILDKIHKIHQVFVANVAYFIGESVWNMGVPSVM